MTLLAYWDNHQILKVPEDQDPSMSGEVTVDPSPQGEVLPNPSKPMLDQCEKMNDK